MTNSKRVSKDSVKKPSKPNGRPPIELTQELADRICDLVASHTCGLERLCNMYPDIPSKFTINLWRLKNESFSSQYARAKLKQAELLAEECLEISDDSSGDKRINPDGFEGMNSEFVARSRLRVDTRKWLASKLLPKQYGDAAKLSDEKKALVSELIDKLVE